MHYDKFLLLFDLHQLEKLHDNKECVHQIELQEPKDKF